MDKINRDVRGWFFIALTFSLLLPFGVFGIIFGAVNGITALLVIGITAAAVGFYGCPFAWIAYAGRRRLRVVLRLILNENVYSVEEIASHLSVQESSVTDDVNALIRGGFLKGFLFKNGFLVLNTNCKQQESDALKKQCPACGGRMVYNGVNYVCDYCGPVEENEKTKTRYDP